MSYAIPTNELTLGDIKGFKTSALNAGIERAKQKGIAASDQELVWREAFPATDLGVAAGYALEYYVTPAAVAAGAWAGCIGLAVPAAPPNLPVGRIAVFYKIYDPAAAPVVTGVRFLLFAATTKASFFIQCFVDSKLEPEVWLSEPVVYDPSDQVNLQMYGRIATPVGGEELGFGCFIIERVGAVVS